MGKHFGGKTLNPKLKEQLEAVRDNHNALALPGQVMSTLRTYGGPNADRHFTGICPAKGNKLTEEEISMGYDHCKYEPAVVHHRLSYYSPAISLKPVEEQAPADNYDMSTLMKMDSSEVFELCNETPHNPGKEYRCKHDNANSCRCRIYRKLHMKIQRRRLIQRFIRESERCIRS